MSKNIEPLLGLWNIFEKPKLKKLNIRLPRPQDIYLIKLKNKVMPTGYTAGILDGEITTFKQFATKCMRNFGATIHMRDEDMSVEYEKRVPSSYFQECLKKAQKKLKQAQTADGKMLVAAEKKELLDSIPYHKESIIKIKKNRKVLDKMLKEAKAFKPPTPEHEGIRKFMIEQLESTIDYDGSTKYHDDALIDIKKQLKNIDVDAIRKRMLDSAIRDIEYYTKEYNEEIERCNKSNEWVEKLLNKLK